MDQVGRILFFTDAFILKSSHVEKCMERWNAFFHLGLFKAYEYKFSILLLILDIALAVLLSYAHNVLCQKFDYLFFITLLVVLVNLSFWIKLPSAHSFSFHFWEFNVGLSYVEKEEVRVLLRQVGLAFYCNRKPFCNYFYFLVDSVWHKRYFCALPVTFSH